MKLIAALCLTLGCLPPALPLEPGWEATHGTPVRIGDATGFRCSGVYLDRGLALTAAHCIEEATLYVEGLQVTRVTYPWPGQDAALLEVPGLAGKKPVLGPQPALGDVGELAGWGCTQGRGLRLLEGVRVLEAVDPVFVKGAGMYETGVCLGDSGGPVYDAQDRLVGVITATRVSGPARTIVTWLTW